MGDTTHQDLTPRPLTCHDARYRGNTHAIGTRQAPDKTPEQGRTRAAAPAEQNRCCRPPWMRRWHRGPVEAPRGSRWRRSKRASACALAGSVFVARLKHAARASCAHPSRKNLPNCQPPPTQPQRRPNHCAAALRARTRTTTVAASVLTTLEAIAAPRARLQPQRTAATSTVAVDPRPCMANQRAYPSLGSRRCVACVIPRFLPCHSYEFERDGFLLSEISSIPFVIGGTIKCGSC